MEPVAKRNWQLRSQLPSSPEQKLLADALNVSEIVARLLWLRGIQSVDSAGPFLTSRLADLPDPGLLPDMDRACQRLALALKTHEKIAVHGDYDVDGITGCSLLVEMLRAMGGEVVYHIPLRLVDGYGLSEDAIREAHQQGCQVILSVDCGVSAHHEASLAKSLGLDLIVTDHHQPPETLPECYALINPHLAGNRFPWPDLAGVGVAFFLILALRRLLRETGYFIDGKEPDVRFVLDLVALGTIADIVPLGGVNRILVKQGLQLLDKSSRPGISELKKVSQVKEVTSGVVGFRLAPRLNAAGRLEDAAMGVELLLNKDMNVAAELAEFLDNCNRERQAVEQQTLQEATAMVENDLNDGDYSIVLAKDNWHSGVIGIVASRLVERYHRPVVMIALENGEGKGSARSISGFHLYEGLGQCQDLLNGFGGHAMAAGLTIRADQVESFRKLFETVARERLIKSQLQPTLNHDGEIFLSSLSLCLQEQIDQLNPYGMGNPLPTFVARDCHIYNCRVVGQKHLKFDVEQGESFISAIAFGMAERMAECSGRVDILFRPGINEWRGERSLQLQIIDFQKAGRKTDD